MKEKVIFNWSGGKDSAFCLYKISQLDKYDILCLLTTVNEQYQRISMHGVRMELLEAQTQSIGLPLQKIMVPENNTMEAYNKVMGNALADLKKQGATGAVYGDIFLEDLRQYREDKLAEIGLHGIFPLWKIPTSQLIQDFLALGFKTIVTCVNDRYLDKSFVGRVIDQDFLNDLPANVDPCGENGEFHTFVFDGLIFNTPIPIVKGETVYRQYISSKSTDSDSYDCDISDTDVMPDTGFWYADVLLG